MGVLNLWKILSPVCNNIDLNELRNKTLAVDLSIWICENSIQSKSFSQANTKPYLRALFFRCKYLLELNCKLIFVREGDVIDLKQETMKKRNQNRFGNADNFSQSQTQSQKPIQKRSKYDSVANEVTHFKNRITVIRSPCGEAEKACAYLNLIGRCDGVITEDSDVFLYGARTVYKNFSLDNKSALTIEEYRMDDIEKQLGYDREALIVLGLLLGCDYDPKGIPGVGKELACKFLHELKEKEETSVLNHLRKWNKQEIMSSQSAKYEEKVKKLVFNNGAEFPNEKIVNEFFEMPKMSETLLSKEKYLAIKWNRPCLMELQMFNDLKQSWPYEYTTEKVVPLITLYEYLNVPNRENFTIKAVKINKKKRKAFIDYYEVLWKKMQQNVDRDLSDLNEYLTLEKIDLFQNVYPELVEEFNREIESKKTTRIKKKKSKNDEFDDEMANSLIEMYESLDKNTPKKKLSPKKSKTGIKKLEEKKKALSSPKYKSEKSAAKMLDFKKMEESDIIEILSPSKWELNEPTKITYEEKKCKKKIKKKSLSDYKALQHKHNYKIIVLDTESEGEDIEPKNSDVIEDDLDLNLLLKSFQAIDLSSKKIRNVKESPTVDLKSTKNNYIIRDNKENNEDDDDDIIEIPFSQRMKNFYKTSQIFD